MSKRPKKQEAASVARTPWQRHFFQRHRQDDPTQAVPAQDFLLACPEKVRAMMLAVVNAVAVAPPPQFSGGGKWEAMHGEMAGYYEIRVDGPKRHHYRLFCLLERDGASVGLDAPSLVLICGREKPFRTVLSARDYAEVRRLGSEHLARRPRSILR